MKQQPKPGYLTTEFWLTIAGCVIAILVLLNVLNSNEAAQWQEVVAALVTIIVPVVAYNNGRARVKSK